ncbi:MAG: hypothetical protein DMF82_10250 [Acidobacteria bacterium]|nr:MAG: hypothetical protein DMF82_10250 [Acidobacteriota bacterium]
MDGGAHRKGAGRRRLRVPEAEERRRRPHLRQRQPRHERRPLAVTRQTLKGEPKEGWFPDQRLTIEEAMEAYTKGPAWAAFEEDQKGTLTPGKLADVAVLDVNLVEAGHTKPADLLKARVLYTVVGGKVVYEAGVAATPR